MFASPGKEFYLALDRFRLEYGFTRGDQHQTLRVAKSHIADSLSIVSHRVLGAIQKDFVALFQQPRGKVHGISSPAGPVVRNKEVVAPEGILNPLKKIAMQIQRGWGAPAWEGCKSHVMCGLIRSRTSLPFHNLHSGT